MPSFTSTGRQRLDRLAWFLWGVTFTVIIALAATVPLIYLPLLDLVGAEGLSQQWIRNGYLAWPGLVGLVLVFCLYTALRHRELNRMREELEVEERELQDVRTRLSEVSALFQLSTTLNLQLNLDSILEIIVRRVVASLKAQQSSIMIYNPESGMLETRASYGLEAEFARNARAKLGQGIAGWVAQQQQAVLLGQKATDTQMGQYYKRNRSITSALSLPLKVGDRCVGVLNVNRISHPDPFREHHREILRLFAEHVGAVIDRAENMERLETHAHNLEASNLQLSEMNRMKDVFLSTASHELKTPLTSVIAYAELLDDHSRALAPKQHGEFLRRLRAEANRLLALIEDILDLSRIETGKLVLRREPRSINAIARAAVETARSTAEKHGVQLVEQLDDELLTLELDEVKMRQVLVNLLVNAVKFSPKDGTVRLATRRDENCVVVEVHDQGPGVRPEEAVHIFELFGQGLRRGDEKASGLGIGLHLVKRLTELHGGHVGLHSEPDQGSTFWVRLPVPAAEPLAEAAEPAIAAA